ncbi:hypothetical protein TRAPUB_4191 [Trametes pubescens]|uniref:Uncharacterized protein n=1 Tax=Trametes pubescens TaxID=154538 RepID=A0A1M2VBV2_TRAPU|nr:hypothetical protein TRAPUB_4191 [Trametes pubescens]
MYFFVRPLRPLRTQNASIEMWRLNMKHAVAENVASVRSDISTEGVESLGRRGTPDVRHADVRVQGPRVGVERLAKGPVVSAE